MGDLASAEIVILMLNPGFASTNIWAETTVPHLQNILWQNLRQSSEGAKLTFTFLDPEFAWHTGFAYWSSRFKKTLQQIMKNKTLTFYEALKWLSQKVAYLQLIPYSSSTGYRARSLTKSLPSAQQAINYARETLVAEVFAGRKMVIVARQVENWALPSHNNILTLSQSAARSAYFESDAILRTRLWEHLGL